MPQPRSFHEAIVAVIDRVCKGRVECVIRAYGEMVDVLWRAGMTGRDSPRGTLEQSGDQLLVLFAVRIQHGELL